MHVALHGREHDLAGAAHAPRRPLLGLEERHEVGDGFLHDAGALHHLRQEHLPRPEQVADDVHPVHERPFDHVDRLGGFAPCFLDVGLDVVHDAFDQRVSQPLDDGQRTPRGIGPGDDRALAVLLGERGQALGRVGAPVEQHILHQHEHVGRDVFIDGELGGVDDAHIHPRLDRVVQERRVHRFTDVGAAAERE